MCGNLWLSSLKQIANSSGLPLLLELNNDVFREAPRRYLSNAQAVFSQDLVKEEREQKESRDSPGWGPGTRVFGRVLVFCVLMCLRFSFLQSFLWLPRCVHAGEIGSLEY